MPDAFAATPDAFTGTPGAGAGTPGAFAITPGAGAATPNLLAKPLDASVTEQAIPSDAQGAAENMPGVCADIPNIPSYETGRN